MAAGFHLEIITPERVFFRGEVESLIVTTDAGKMGILKGHAPIVAALEAGVLEMMTGGKWLRAAAAEGFLTVWREGVEIMTHSVLWPEEIDRARAEAQERRAREALRQARSKEEYIRFKVQTARAMARLSLYGDRNINLD